MPPTTTRCLGAVGRAADDKAYQQTLAIERAIVSLNLDSQGEFGSLINTILMQLESGRPVERVVRLVADALLALSEARGVDEGKRRLRECLDTVVKRVGRIAREAGGR